MGKSAATVANAATKKEPVLRAPEDAFARAVAAAGSESRLAERSGLTADYVHEIMFEGIQLEADLCPAVERAVRSCVTCEDLRPELIWHRDATGEVVGYSSPIDTTRDILALCLPGVGTAAPLVDGKWDALSYRAGIMHGLPAEERDGLLGGVYASAQDWTRSGLLDSLQADCDVHRSTSAHDCCYGMLWDFDDATRDALLDKFNPGLSRDWGQGKYDAMWADAQAIRASEPFKSSTAQRAYLAGMASIVDVHGDGADFIDFFTADNRVSLGDAEDMARATEYALGLILDAALKPAREDAAAWGNLVAGSTHQVYAQIGTQTAERIGRTAANLLDLMLPGLEAIHDYQYVVMNNGNEDCLDSKSPVSLCVFQMIMQQLTQQLVVLRQNALTRQKELEA